MSIKEETGINRELFKKHFGFQMPTSMLNVVYNTDSKKKHGQLVHVIKNGLSDLEDEVEKMSEDVKESEKPDKIVDIVKKVL